MINSEFKSQIGRAFLVLAGTTILTYTSLSAQEAFVSLGIEGSFRQSFSAGQMVNTTLIGSSGSASHGVLQTYEISVAPETTGTETAIGLLVELSVFPNPAADFLILSHQSPGTSQLSASVFNTRGAAIDHRAITDSKTLFDLKHLVPGTYFLRVTEGQNLVKTFKIIKN